MILYISMVSIATSFWFMILLFWTSIFLFLGKCVLSFLFIFSRSHLIFVHLFQCCFSVSHLVACYLALTCLCFLQDFFFFFFLMYFISSLVVLYWKKKSWYEFNFSQVYWDLFCGLTCDLPSVLYILILVYLMCYLGPSVPYLFSVWMIWQLVWVEYTSLLLLLHYLLPVYSFMSVNIFFINSDKPMFNE